MSSFESPAVVAYDGSPAARAAVEAAATLFGERGVVVVSVWESGLAMAMATMPASDTQSILYVQPRPEDVVAIDRAQRDHAMSVAQEGVRLVEYFGGQARPYPVAEDISIADGIGQVADELDACAVVVGTRGHGAVKSKLLGSTSGDLLHRSRRPVVVVRAHE